MRCPSYWLTAVLVLLGPGCASPLFSKAGSRGNPESDAQQPGEAKVSDSPSAAGTARVADRTGSEYRSAPRNASTIERRTAELLESASRSQRSGRLDVAKSAYEQVLRLDPQNRTAHFQLACIADDEARFADAERHYGVLMRLTPRDPDLLASLGWSYLLQGKYDACERTLREALQFAPAHQTALYNLGWLYGMRGDYDQALAIFRSAGSEADAQRALADVQRSARAASAAAGHAVEAAPGDPVSPSAIGGETTGGGSVVPASYSVADGRQGPNNLSNRKPAAMNGSPVGRGMTAPAPWKNAPPTQANHPRQADPQTYDVGVDRAAAPGTLSETVEAANASPPIGQGGPVITPAVTGRGGAGSRQVNIIRNNLPRAGTSTTNGNSLGPATTANPGAPPMNAVAQPRLPGWKPLAAGEGAEVASLAGPAPRAAGGSGQAAPLTAAQLTAARWGLSAGLTGPYLPVGDWIDPEPAPASASSGATTAPGAEHAGRPSVAAGGRNIGTVPAAPQQPTTTQTAGYGSATGLAPSAPPAAGLPPWPGGVPVPTAVPTDVTPVPPTPRL